MSWSFEFTGTPEAVKANVLATCEQLATSYKGQQEAKDIVAVRDRFVDLINDASLPAPFNGVSVKANGSHYVYSSKVASASFSASFSRVQLTL